MIKQISFLLVLFMTLWSSTIKAQYGPNDDLDGDGIINSLDLDDDNDGIVDAEESPECFYNVFEANRIVSITSPFNGDGTDPLAGNDITLLYNDNLNDGGTSTAFNFASGQTVTPGTPIFTVRYPTPIVLASLTVVQNTYGMTSASVYGKLYGSNDGVSYTLLTTGNGLSLASSPQQTFSNTSTVPYLYYQIRYIGTSSLGNATNSTLGTAAIHEITSLVSTTVPYIASAHPKLGTCSADADGDLIPNHLDLDSDGDGCPDAYEGGATTNKNVSVIPGPYGANGLANSLETGIESGEVNYKSTYYKYAVNSNEKLCLDTDNDGVSDPIDIDDDNDGVLDTDEGSFCGKLDRNIRVGYLNVGAGSNGLATNLLYNLNNFGISGTFNKVRGVTLIPYTSAAAVTEANLLADNIDVFFVGSTANDNNNATGSSSTEKVPSSVNIILANWAKNNNKGIFALQNNAIDFGYKTTDNNTNPDTPSGTIGKDVYTNGYWPTPTLNQSGGVQMTVISTSRTFDILMTDANLRPVVIADREYNLVIFPDATIYNDNSGMVTPDTNDKKAIADTWSYVFDKYLNTQCSFLDTDGDGIPNHLDLDSDNDGCSDATESGATGNKSSNFSFTSQAGTSTDTNSDGLADIVDANLNGIPDYLSFYKPNALDGAIKQCTDSDGDGIADLRDLDDDNDGILDTDEGLSCNSLNRNLRIGYLNTTLGKSGLMMNMLNNGANFSLGGTYNKFPGITFVPYSTEAAITEAQLLSDNIDIFYTGSSANDAQTTADKLLTATNTRILNWASNYDKGVIVLQNNATDYGYIINNAYPNSNPSTPYGTIGDSVFTNGYWPSSTFSMSGTVQMSINSISRNYDTAMADVQGKATFIKDRDRKIVFIPDATIFIDNQTVSTIGSNTTLKVAADVWAFAFDTFIKGNCNSRDTDGDGIPDYLDLDSDNDGCTDAIEGGGNFTNSQLVAAASSLSVGTGSTAANQNLCASGACVDANGIPTIAGISGQGIGYSDNADIKMCTDSDGDGVPDVCDLDDDNDGILDVNENQCNNGDTKNVRIGYIPNSRDLDGDNGYTFDGGYMSNSGALKLTNPANFGPSGIVNANITLVPITANPITKADITALNLNAVFIGGIDGLTASATTYLSDSELYAIKDWSDDAASNVVVVTQIQSKMWSSTITSGNINPDKPTPFGSQTSIFNGPFGNITSFNQGGGYQAYFATLNGACSTKKLAIDNSGRTVMYLDGIYNDLIIADVDILTTLGGVTSGSAITSNNDKLFGNIWAFVVSQSSCFDVDTDGDGIPNRLDLDSDNDGCTDAIEGAGNFTSSQLTSASGILSSQSPNQNFGTVVDTDGIPIVVGAAGQGVGQSQDSSKNDCVDSDGDGIPDWQDLDDDNDGILDTVECPTFNIFADYASATITGAATANATVSNIIFNNVTGTLTRVNTGVTVELGISKATRNLSNATIYTPAGSTTQAALSERLANFNNTTNYTTYTLTLNKPVESITLHIENFDNLRTRFTGSHKEQLISGGTELKYDLATRQLYDIDPTTVSQPTRDGYGSVKITSTDGSPITQIVFQKFNDPNATQINDAFYYTFSLIPICDTDGDGIPNSLDLDSDNDGCLDALEGDENVTTAMLVNAGGTVTVGTGSSANNQNLCAGTSCVDANGVPTQVNSGGAADIGGNQGQGLGESENATIQSGCFCYKPATTTGTTLDTNHGITALGRAGADNGNWPMVRKGAWTALESKEKGFVVNRVKFNASNQPVAADGTTLVITSPVEGMMVYDTTNNCLKVYTTTDGTTFSWKCFNTPACPD